MKANQKKRFQIGDVVYTKAVTVLDIGIVKNEEPLEIYGRNAPYDGGTLRQYGGVGHCQWYNSGVNLNLEAWKELTFGKSTQEICESLGIPYVWKAGAMPERRINPERYAEKSDTALKDKMHRFLSDNKISYETMIRAVNFWQDMTAEERGRMSQ